MGVGLVGDIDLINQVITVMSQFVNDDDYKDSQIKSYYQIIFMGALLGGHVQTMDVIFARIKDFDLMTFVTFRRVIEFSTNLPTYDRPFMFRSYDGLWYLLDQPKYQILREQQILGVSSFTLILWNILSGHAPPSVLEQFLAKTNKAPMPFPCHVSIQAIEWMSNLASPKVIEYGVRINDMARIQAMLATGYDDWTFLALCLKKYNNMDMTTKLLRLYPVLGGLLMNILFRERDQALNLSVIRSTQIYKLLISQGFAEPQDIPYPLNYYGYHPRDDPLI